jgi:hypothetical protein
LRGAGDGSANVGLLGNKFNALIIDLICLMTSHNFCRFDNFMGQMAHLSYQMFY